MFLFAVYLRDPSHHRRHLAVLLQTYFYRQSWMLHIRIVSHIPSYLRNT